MQDHAGLTNAFVDKEKKMATKGRDNWRKNVKTMDGLRRRYSHLHPLIFQRTIERATSAGEVFDILEGIPNTFPLVWNDNDRKWIVTNLWLEEGKS